MTPEELRERIRKHGLWLKNEDGGERFVAIDGADLSRANLSGANLYGANLSRANLSGANLYGANLSGANLYGADLSRANLSRANLYGADLSGANLSRANLSRANLSRANLYGANLSGADLDDLAAHKHLFYVCPEEGAFTAFKKVRYGGLKAAILVCQVPEDAKRVSTPMGRKCRASALLPIRAENLDGTPLEGVEEFFSSHDHSFEYKLGKLATVEDFCDDMREECRPGLHFFITRREAQEY